MAASSTKRKKTSTLARREKGVSKTQLRKDLKKKFEPKRKEL